MRFIGPIVATALVLRPRKKFVSISTQTDPIQAPVSEKKGRPNLFRWLGLNIYGYE